MEQPVQLCMEALAPSRSGSGDLAFPAAFLALAASFGENLGRIWNGDPGSGAGAASPEAGGPSVPGSPSAPGAWPGGGGAAGGGRGGDLRGKGEPMSGRSLLYKREISWEDVRRFLELREPEREWLDYKRELSNTVVKAIAAMANTNGGLILIGVDEESERPRRIVPGRIVGVGPDDRMSLEHKCRDLLDPPYIPEIWPVEIPPEALGEGRETSGPRCLLVVRVDPERVPLRPVIFREGQAGKVLIRRGASSEEADPRTLRDLFAASSHPAFPIQAVLPFWWTPDALRQAAAPFLERRQLSTWIAFRLGYEERRMGSSGRPWITIEREAIRDWLNGSPLRGWINDSLRKSHDPFDQAFVGGIPDLFERSKFKHLPEFAIVKNQSGLIILEPQWPDENPPVHMQVKVERVGRISIDLAFSERIMWSAVFLLMGMTLLTASHPELIQRCFPEPGWSPRLRGCLLGEPGLGETIILDPRWHRVGAPNPREAILDEPWEGGGLREIEEVLRRFWARMLHDLGYLGFEEDLKSLSLPR